MSIQSGTRSLIRRLQGERRAQRAGGRRATDREPNRGWIPVLAVAIPIALLDWTVKWLVVRNVPLYDFRLLWPEHVAIWHVTNPALVLGLHGGLPLAVRKGLVSIYALLSIIFLIAVLGRGHRLLPHRRKWVWLFLGMVLGGMIGNLGERLFHWGVTDFLSLRWGNLWLPPGNLADLSIILSLPISFAVLAFEMEARSLRGASARESVVSAPAAEAGTLPPLEA
jgi:signal peptidase II